MWIGGRKKVGRSSNRKEPFKFMLSELEYFMRQREKKGRYVLYINRMIGTPDVDGGIDTQGLVEAGVSHKLAY